MPTACYTVSVHPQGVEGICWTKQGERFVVQEAHSAAFRPATAGNLQEKIGHFLEAHQWRGQAVRFILPTEAVSFRRLHFPFQDKKKIRQILPFEVESEVLEEGAVRHYQYLLQPQPDGSAEVLLLFADPTYLPALLATAQDHDLLIQNVDCAAHALFQSAVPLEEGGILFQIYLGADEVFINVIEGHMLHTVKTFPSRLAIYFQQFAELPNLPPETLLKRILAGDAASGENEEAQGILALREEIRAVCGQFNLFLKTWQLKGSIQVSLHGLLGVAVAWNGQSFQLWEAQTEPTPIAESQGVAPSFSQPLDSARRHLEAGKFENSGTPPAPLLPQKARAVSVAQWKMFTTLAPLSEFAPHWGILGELKRQGLQHLEGRGLSFFSQGTPIVRFFKTYRLPLLLAGVFLLLIAGSWGGNYYLKLQLLKKELQITAQQLQNRLNPLVANNENLDVSSAIATLQAQVIQKREAQQETRFHQRTYPSLFFLKKLSQSMPEALRFNLKRLEWDDGRFRMSGNANSYEELEMFKKTLEAFEEFQGHPVVADYRKVNDQIFYTILVNRSP